MKQLTLLVMTILFIAATDAVAGNVSVRLAEAYNKTPAKVSPALADVAGVLKRTLNFNSCDLLGSTAITNPGGDTVTLGNFQLDCKKQGSNMAVTIKQRGKSILSTNINLAGKKPVIIGGLKGSKGKIVFIFVAQ